MDQSTILKTKYAVTSADTDMFSRLKPGALVNFLIQSAVSSAESLGFGFGDLKENHLFWVLNRLTVEIYRPVKWDEVIEVTTWPKDIERIFYLRDFIVKDAEGEIVAKANSAWLAIDLKTKTPSSYVNENMLAFTKLKDFHALDYPPIRVKSVKADSSMDVIPTFFDIDLNKHVTSTRYIDWMTDAFSVDFHKDHYPKQLSINYQKETMIGERIEVKHQADEDNHCFEGFNHPQEKIAFRGKVVF
ncbi:MAG: thioesterase [Carboxylicivirga sp.]|jgi:acyl-ACP thioesterase|nr:thioesterase [Carboxylicivirga sp.]